MSNFASSAVRIPQERLHSVSLCVTFAVGFLSGVAFGWQNSADFCRLVHLAVLTPVSISSLLLTLALPWILTAMLYWSNMRKLFLVLSFFQAFFYGIASSSVYFVFGSAYWLICSLLLFSCTVNLILLHCFFFRHLCCKRHAVWRDFALLVAISFFAASLDLFFISPLLFGLSFY